MTFAVTGVALAALHYKPGTYLGGDATLQNYLHGKKPIVQFTVAAGGVFVTSLEVYGALLERKEHRLELQICWARGPSCGSRPNQRALLSNLDRDRHDDVEWHPQRQRGDCESN